MYVVMHDDLYIYAYTIYSVARARARVSATNTNSYYEHEFSIIIIYNSIYRLFIWNVYCTQFDILVLSG